MCASVCPSEALWYGTVEEFHETRRGLAHRRLALRPPARCAPRSTPSSTTSPAGRSTCSAGSRPAPGSTTRSASTRTTIVSDEDAHDARVEAGLPLRGRRRGGGHPPRVRPLPRGRRRRDGRRQRRPRHLDPAPLHQHRRTPADRRPRATSPSARPTCSSYPTDDDPAILVRLGERDVVAFSQKCTHLGCVVLLRGRREPLALPLPRGQLRRAARGACSPGRPPGPSVASTSRSATTG